MQTLRVVTDGLTLGKRWLDTLLNGGPRIFGPEVLPETLANNVCNIYFNA
jgi:hypothetical protein